MNLFKLTTALFLLAACGKDPSPETEWPINATALSRVSHLLADRETYWWTEESADTVRLHEGVPYGATVSFYHIQGSDTVQVLERVLNPENKAFLFWESSDSTIQIDFKGGPVADQGLHAFLLATEPGGPFLLNLKLCYQADTITQTGEVEVIATFPVLVK